MNGNKNGDVFALQLLYARLKILRSSNLLAAGFASSILIAQIKFQEEDDKISGFECEVLKEIHHETRVQSLAWCPKTSLVVAPKLIEFATSELSFKRNYRVFLQINSLGTLYSETTNLLSIK